MRITFDVRVEHGYHSFMVEESERLGYERMSDYAEDLLKMALIRVVSLKVNHIPI